MVESPPTGGKDRYERPQNQSSGRESGEMAYPKDIPQTIHAAFKGFYLVKGTEIALRAGDVRAANVVLLGGISKFFKVGEELWLKTILNNLPAKVHDLNRKAFAAGRDQINFS
jgi:indolepyruvate ferredoxin oxidoreductase, beta subunit